MSFTAAQLNKQQVGMKEPKIKWHKSEARRLLYEAIVRGDVPAKAKDEQGKSTGQLLHIYYLIPELSKYRYKSFSSRLSKLQEIFVSNDKRAKLDKEAFNNYIKNHKPVADLHKGNKQWQGSRVQMLAQKDIAAGKHDMPGMTKEKLHRSKPEYREFPLKAFRDKYQQEISTKKYLYTIKKIGRDPKKWKKQHSSHMKKKKKDQQGSSNKNDASSSALRDDESNVE
jgi:hypothetical protein